MGDKFHIDMQYSRIKHHRRAPEVEDMTQSTRYQAIRRAGGTKDTALPP